jgi:hypothetical protein
VLGCDFDKNSGEKSKKGEKGTASGRVVGTDVNPSVNRVLPHIMVDGPFGLASEDFLKYETAPRRCQYWSHSFCFMSIIFSRYDVV